MDTIDQLPSGRKGQAAALIILASICALLWLLIIDPIQSSYVDLAEAQEQRRALLRRLEARALQLPRLREAVASTDKGPGQVVSLVGNSDAIAGAALQQLIKAAAEASGVTISSVETLVPDRSGPLHRIPVRVVLTASWAALFELLQSLANQEKGLVVDDLQLRNSSRPGAAVGSAWVEATWTVTGFRNGAE